MGLFPWVVLQLLPVEVIPNINVRSNYLYAVSLAEFGCMVRAISFD